MRVECHLSAAGASLCLIVGESKAIPVTDKASNLFAQPLAKDTTWVKAADANLDRVTALLYVGREAVAKAHDFCVQGVPFTVRFGENLTTVIEMGAYSVLLAISPSPLYGPGPLVVNRKGFPSPIVPATKQSESINHPSGDAELRAWASAFVEDAMVLFAKVR